MPKNYALQVEVMIYILRQVDKMCPSLQGINQVNNLCVVFYSPNYRTFNFQTLFYLLN